MRKIVLVMLLLILQSILFAQYCTPSFPSGTEPICRVQFNTIDNSSSCTPSGASYENYTTISTSLTSGNTYPITIWGNTNGNFTNHINVYIDWNNNGVLNDAGENYYLGSIINCANCSATGNIVVPAGVSGPIRMRIVKKYNTQGDPCNSAGFGQAEDYTITIADPFSFYNTAAVAGTQTSFNHIKLQSTTPTFTVSSSSFANFDRVQLEINTVSNFTGVAYTQTFSGAYLSGTKYDLQCNTLTPVLPATEATYFVRGRTSNNGGSTWSSWSTSLWAYTNGPTYWGWHFTSNAQFSSAALVSTNYGNHLNFNNNATSGIAIDDYIELNIGTSLNLLTTAGDQALTEGTNYYSGTSDDCITVGYYNVTTVQDYHGFRFQNAAIPPASSILAASFQPYAHSGSGCGGSANSTNQLMMVIKGVDQDNCAAWANTTNTGTGAPRYRLRTVAGDTWNVPSGTTQQWTVGQLITTAPDITNIIQEIINKLGYTAGNAIGLIVDHNGAAGNYWRYFATMSANASYRARLATSFTNFENSIRFPNVVLTHYVNAANWDQLIFTQNTGCTGCYTSYEVRNAQSNALIVSGNTSPINLNSSTVDSVYVIAKIYRTNGSPQILDLTLTTIQSILPPVADFSANHTDICAGDCIDFTDLSTNTPTSWNWTFTGSASPSSSIQNPTGICYNNAGTYPVILEATNLGGSDTESKVTYITVHANPVVDLGPDTSICSGQSLILDAGAGYTSYVWTPAGSTQTINVTTGGTYSVVVSDGNSCTGTNQIIVNVVGQQDATITTTDLTYCTNDGPVNLTATDPGGNWSGVGITNSSSGTFNPGTAGAGTHTITYGIPGACGDTATISLTVYQAPTVHLGLDTTICQGQILVLDAGAGYTSYVWTPAGSTQTINVTTAGTYSVVVTDDNTCIGTDQIIVTVQTQQDATIITAGPFCINEPPVQFISADPGGVWSGTGISGTGLFNPSTAGTGTYTITYTIAGDCGDVDTQSITVNETPSGSITFENESCIGANDGSATILITGGLPPYSILWSNNENTATITGLIPGTYNITFTDLNGCQSSGALTILGASEDCNTPHVFIPNVFSPNGDGQNDVFYIRGEGIQFLEFIVFSRWGELLFKSTDQTNGWDGSYKGKPLNSGVYAYYLKATLANGEIIKLYGDITLVR